jgi:hypothetical protein
MAYKTLVQRLDMNITGEQAHRIKWRTWSYKKMTNERMENTLQHEMSNVE